MLAGDRSTESNDEIGGLAEKTAPFRDAFFAAQPEIPAAVDAAIAEVMESAPGADLVVMSDHGFTTFDRAVNLNTWLWKNGYLALDGGPDGLGGYRTIATIAPRLLRPAGCLLVEIGIGQESAISELFTQNGLAIVAVRHDLSGIPRVLAATLR